MTTDLQPLAYSVKEAIRLSSLKKTTIYSLIGSGELEVVRIGRRTLIKAQSLHDLINPPC